MIDYCSGHACPTCARGGPAHEHPDATTFVLADHLMDDHGAILTPGEPPEHRAQLHDRLHDWPADLRRLSSEPLPPGVFDGPFPCPYCGHDMSTTPTHNIRPCEECDDAAQLGQYAPCQTVDLPAGAIVDDPDDLAVELVAEYAAAVERDRDRAQEARYGARLILRIHPDGPGPRPGWALPPGASATQQTRSAQ